MAKRVKLYAPTLAANFCLGDVGLQGYTNFIFNNAYGELPDGDDYFVISENEPAAEDRDKIWVRLIDGALDRFYNYNGGEWRSPHPVPASGSEVRLWLGTAQELITYDGGDDDALGDASGAMWEIDHRFDARFPLGCGTLPDSGTVVTPLLTGGSEKVTLEVTQIPAHEHTYNGKGDTGAGGDSGAAWVGDGADQQTEETGGGEAHDNMPPWVGVRYIKRTSRIYYKAE